MKVEVKTITPELATRMLALNTGNRPVSRAHVASLAKEMSKGRWKLNGDTICLNGQRLIDGQHRLQAIVASGVAIQSLVVEGLDSTVFDTKDCGKRRSAADTLSVRGEVQTRTLAGALAVVDRYLTGRVAQNVKYTNTEIEELLDKHPGVRESVNKAKETKKLVPQSVLIACHYLFSKKDPEAADQFVNELIGGRNMQEGDAVYLVRERLMSNALSKAKLHPSYIMALLIKAWNARRSGTVVRNIRFRQEGDAPEAFPIIQ